jgi:hypothetical protein
MKLTLKRIAFKPTYTIGKLYVNGTYFCDTIEDKDRALTQSMSTVELKNKKVKGETCIPYGKYSITLDVVSGKYSNFVKYPYVKFCNGKMPRLLNVPGFDGILIHAGNTDKDTDGCILVGQNKVVGKVINSQATWAQLYKTLQAKKQEGITIEILK